MSGRPTQPKILQIEETILEMAEDDPTISTRATAAQVEVCHSKVWKTLTARTVLSWSTATSVST